MHIRLGEPVGSKFLTQDQQISLSSATIRNEMAELEEMGYLEQPHTSAGRVPSRAGYRLYVDSLMNRYPVTSRETEEVEGLADSRQNAFEKVLEQAGRLIAALTNYTSLTMKAGRMVAAVRRFDAVWVEEQSFILVMTLDGDTVQSRTVHLPFPASPEDLRLLTGVLNDAVAGLTMEQINLPIMLRMENELGPHANLLSPVIKSVYEVIGKMEPGDIRFEGINRLLQYPEFSDISRMREMFDMLENKEEIMTLIMRSRTDRVNVIIGGETGIKPMENATLIFRTLTDGGRVVGAIGVIGPCRMEYAKAVTLIELLADKISDMLEHPGNSVPLLGEYHP